MTLYSSVTVPTQERGWHARVERPAVGGVTWVLHLGRIRFRVSVS